MEQSEDTTRIGRRDMVKKAAVAGAVAWTAPMILSSRVSATGGTCPDPPNCQYYYMVRVDAGSCSADSSFPSGGGFSNPDCNGVLSNVESQLGGSVLTAPGGCSDIATNISFSTTQVSFKLKPGFKVVGVIFKDGPGCPSSDTSGACWTEGLCDSNGNRSVTLGGCSGIQSSWSNITAIVCSDTQL